MKTIQTKLGELLLVKVHKDVYNFELDYHNYFPQVFVNFKTKIGVLDLPLTDGNNLDNSKFKIIGKFSQLEDKDFEEFVFQWGQNMSRDIVNFCILGYSDIVKIDKNNNLCYKNYLDNFNNNYTLTPKESFISLCKSQGIEDNLDNYLIIKKL